MQKSLKIVLISCILVAVAGLLAGLYFFVINKDDNIYVKEISLSENLIVLNVEDTYKITNIMQIAPANYNVQVMCFAENSNYISILDGYTIKAKSIGETKVVIKALTDKDNYINKVLNINIVEKPTYPNSFNFEKSKVVLEVGKSATNEIVSSTPYTAEPIVTYSVENICSYDFLTGIVLAKNVGTTIVTASFTTENGIVENSFEVIVSKNKARISLDYKFEDDKYIINASKGESIRVVYKLYDAEGNETEFNIDTTIVTNGTDCEIIAEELKYIKIVNNNVGQSVIRIFSADDNTIFVDIKIIVGE